MQHYYINIQLFSQTYSFRINITHVIMYQIDVLTIKRIYIQTSLSTRSIY